MKKLFVFAVAFIAFTGFTFPVEKTETTVGKATVNVQDMFSYFRIHRQAKNVVVNWGITNSAGLSKFVVERSYDGEYFDEVSEVTCNGSAKYSCKDLSVFPGYIYYRIACKMTDESVHYSAVEVIRIVQH